VKPSPLRLLVVAVAAVVVLAGGVLVLGDDERPGGTTPAADGTLPGPGPTADLGRQGPVLLIPGYGGGAGLFQGMRARLQAAGIPSEAIDVGDGTQDLTGYAALVIERARQLVAAGAPSVDLVGFSAGGITARIAAASPQGGPLIRRVVTIASPHEGTRLAALGQLVGECPTACVQLAPGSDLLESLAPATGPERFFTLWTRSDDVIRPPESSELEDAAELVVQDVCNRPVAHVPVLEDSLTLAAVPAWLSGQPLPASCPAV
jgi:triacylglycerol esterase/lipase EstA (alpha/beta hydrolase family)